MPSPWLRSALALVTPQSGITRNEKDQRNQEMEILVRTADGTRVLAQVDPDAPLALVESP